MEYLEITGTTLNCNLIAPIGKQGDAPASRLPFLSNFLRVFSAAANDHAQTLVSTDRTGKTRGNLYRNLRSTLSGKVKQEYLEPEDRNAKVREP